MADNPDKSQLLSPSKCDQSWGIGPKYIEVPPDEERIHKKKQWSGRYLKYGIIFLSVALLVCWLTWLTLKGSFQGGSAPTYVLSAEAMQDLREDLNSTERDRRYNQAPDYDYDGTLPTTDVGRCQIIGGLQRGERGDVSQVLVQVGEKAGTVADELVDAVTKGSKLAAIVGSGGTAAVVFTVTDMILEKAQGEDDWEECIIDQVMQMNKNQEYHKLRKLLTSHKTLLNSELTNMYNTYKSSGHRAQMEQELWDKIIGREDDIKTEALAQFRTKFEESYESAAYFALPYFAAVHFQYQMIMIEWSQTFKLVPDIAWMGAPLPNVGRLRVNLTRWIRFYAEVALKYWRTARDNWCKEEAISTNKCGCKCVSPPYKKYLPAWARLAAWIGDTRLQQDITKWLESHKIKTGDGVAFKYNTPMDELSSGFLGLGTSAHLYKDLSDSNSKSGWLSCAGERAYCYLRDCPNDYWSSRKSCFDEEFQIENEAGSSGSNIVSGSRVFLKAEPGQYLYLYKCGDIAPVGPMNANPIQAGTNWWNTEPLSDKSFMSTWRRSKNNPHAVHISLTPQSYAYLPPYNLWTETFGQQLLERPGNPVLESGDFVRIESEYSCSRSENVMDGWFEIVKTSTDLITNQWESLPRLELFK